jgi:flagellar hook-associated protein 2
MASAINFSGIGSSIDFSLITDAIVADRMRPVTQLQAKSSNLGSHSSALKQLNGLLANLTNAATALTSKTLGVDRASASSDSSIVTAATTTAAVPGTIALNIGRLATTLTQASNNFASTSTALVAGDPLTATATFELRKGGSVSGAVITIDPTNNSLTGLRDAINAAGAGVTASIVDIGGDGTQNQLVLTSTATGATGRVELVETTATGTGATLNMRSLNPPGGVVDFSALDAQLTLNGLSITRSTNTISDALEGVTLNLQKAGLATINVTAASDIADGLRTFVNAYNSVQSFITSQYKQDAEGKATGLLAGDSTLRLVQRQLRETLNSLSTTNGGSLTKLSDIGISRSSEDILKLDTSVLNSKLENNLGDVKALLSGANGATGLFNSINTSLSNLSNDVTGVVQTAINGYQSSIKSLSRSIADQTARISVMRSSLTLQFAKVDAAIGQINSQGTALTAIIDSLKPRTN